MVGISTGGKGVSLGILQVKKALGNLNWVAPREVRCKVALARSSLSGPRVWVGREYRQDEKEDKNVSCAESWTLLEMIFLSEGSTEGVFEEGEGRDQRRKSMPKAEAKSRRQFHPFLSSDLTLLTYSGLANCPGPTKDKWNEPVGNQPSSCHKCCCKVVV